MNASYNILLGGLSIIPIFQACEAAIERAVESYEGGNRDPLTLAAHATGFTDWAIKTGNRINQLNANVKTVFSNAPIEERFPAAIDVGLTSVSTAATLVGAGQLALSGAKAAGVSRLQSITNNVNNKLGTNPTIARNVLSNAEYAAGQSNANVARLQYGNAVERLVDVRISNSWFDRLLFKHVGGPSNPDFIGKGILRGMNFDITTLGQVSKHLLRPGYGLGLKVVTYSRPWSFKLFP